MKIDSDGDVAVTFGYQAWLYNPGLLIPVTEGNVDVLDDETDKESDEEDEDDFSGNFFIYNYYRTTQFLMTSYHVKSLMHV